MSDKMKAYRVTDRDGISECAEIIFAETQGKAKQSALCTDAFEDFRFTDILARRIPALDEYYRGEYRLDWEHPEDRVAMVRFGGFTCHPDYVDTDECRTCPAREWCDSADTYLNENSAQI